MDIAFADLLRLIGAGQFSILMASALVPIRLQWQRDLASLPTLHRQMYWTYGGYVVLGIVALGGISLGCAHELASGTPLARAVCVYGAIFWGVRLALQAVFDVKPYLTRWWLKAGYHLLTVLFLLFTVTYLLGAVRNGLD